VWNYNRCGESLQLRVCCVCSVSAWRWHALSRSQSMKQTDSSWSATSSTVSCEMTVPYSTSPTMHSPSPTLPPIVSLPPGSSVASFTLGPFFVAYQNLPGRCLVCKHGSHVINIPKADWSSMKNKQLTATPC